MFHSNGSSFESDSEKPSMAGDAHAQVGESGRQREDGTTLTMLAGIQEKTRCAGSRLSEMPSTRPAHSPCTIKRKTRLSKKSQYGTILQYHPTHPRRIHLPEKFDRRATHTDRAPKIHFEQCACIGIRGALDLTQNPEPGIVEHDVESPKDFLGASKGGGDVRGTGNVEGEDEELGRGVLLDERGENGGFAKCGDDDVAFAEDNLGEGFSEPGGRAGDCRWRCVSVSQYFGVSGTH